MNKIFLHVILLICSINVFAQNIHKDESNLVMKIEHRYNNITTEFPTVFFILNRNLINNLKTIKVKCDEPCVGFEFTKMGGYCIKDAPDDIYTQACCRSGDIKLSMSSYDSIDIMNQERDTSLASSCFTENILEYSKAFHLSYVDSAGKYKGSYKLSFWIANVDYCICDIYMDRVPTTIYNNQIAYVTKVLNVNKLTKKECKKIKKFVENLGSG